MKTIINLMDLVNTYKSFRQLYLILIILFSISVSNLSAQETVNITSLLNDMIDRDAIAKFPEENFRLKQHSSYNRASVTPSETSGWFTNHDFNSSASDMNFIRTEDNNGTTEWVLMDHQGPGALVRTWMPWLNSSESGTDIQMNIYLDGNPVPVMSGNMLEMFNGDGAIPYPLAHKSLRSAVSFFPIPYAQSCKITTNAMPFFFQFTFREYDQGTSVETFTMEDFNAANTLTQEVGNELLNPTQATVGQTVSFIETLAPQEEKTVALPVGNAAIKSLQIKLDNYTNSSSRGVVLKMNFDGKETVWCPIGDFFGNGIGLNPYQGWYRTVDEDGTLSCRWVMPYQSTGEISIVNLGESDVNVSMDAVVSDWVWDSESMYFNAAWKGEYPVSTRPYSDWNYITLQGKGVYVGDALTIMNPVTTWWGEGDEKIWVDGEDFPSIFGTGTEDYYGYSWGGVSSDFYEHPFHAQPFSYKYNKLNRSNTVEKNTLGYSTETRSRALDVMPFGTSLQLDMEVWTKNATEDMAYGVGVYWYGFAATTSNRTPDPDGVLPLPPLPEELQPEEPITPPDVDDLPMPQSFYDFEGNTIQAVDSGTLANHGSIIGNEVTRTSGGIYAQDGENDNCVEFSGTAWAGSISYVDIPYADFFSADNYTFTSWIKYNTNTTKNYGYLLYQGGNVWPEAQPASRSVDLWMNNNTGINSELYDTSGSKVNTGSSVAIDVYDGEWHLVGVSMENNNILKLWVDGRLAATTEHTSNFKTNETANLWLGARPHKGGTAVKLIGKMDRVRLWDVALSEDQMALLTFIEGPEGGTVEWPTLSNDKFELSNQIKLYPNPASRSLTITNSLGLQVSVFDILGKQILNSNIKKNKQLIDISALKEGIYFFKIFNTNSFVTKKLVVKK